MNDQLWTGQVGDLILARMRGVPNEALLRACQEQVLDLARVAGRGKVLYDVLEMIPPPAELTFVQLDLDRCVEGIALRRAIVVPNSRLAYLARIAFGEGEYRVFYNDIAGAISWLDSDTAAHMRTA